ncbi:HD-GYP domain-containing protein [Candidatus Omnitrophota bacterium]
MHRSYREIKDTYIEMIFRFALAAEYRDETTGAHLARIGDYCVEIARESGMSKRQIEYLRYASLLHDIGKLAIPDSILKKHAAGLTRKQRKIIEGHPGVGEDILRGSRSLLLRAASQICLTHHERFDGSGYPRGLKGKGIPLFGRIVAVADVFDALTSKRTYKGAYGFERALEIIKKESGSHFDPEIVKAFLKRKKRIRRIWEATHEIEDFSRLAV